MELTELKFSVDTSELDVAVKKLETLTTAVEKLNTENNKTSAASSASSAASKKQAKATEELADSTEGLVEATSKADKLLERLKNTHGDLVAGFTKGESSILNQARAYGVVGDSLDPFMQQLKLLKELTKDPFDASIGAIRSVQAELEKIQQRGTLAAQGIALTNKQLEEYSRLAAEVKGKLIQLGIDPKSVEGQAQLNTELKKAQGEYLGIARAVNSLTADEKALNKILKDNEAMYRAISKEKLQEYANSIGKVSDELQELNTWYRGLEAESNRVIAANDKVAASMERIQKITSMVKSGMSEREAGQRVDLSSQGVDEATINKLINAEKELIATRQKGIGVDREKLNAIKYVAREEERLDAVMRELNRTNEDGSKLDEKHARSLANFERNLRQAGISGEEAVAKLNKFRTIQAKLTAEEEKRQALYLQRGLQPQIGDVVVSLASGQNPLTVMLQQGDQIRGLIAQTGVQGEALKKAFRDAMSGTVESIKMTAGAMVSLLGGAIATTGKNIMGLVTGPLVALSDGFKQAKKDGSDLSVGMATGVMNAVRAIGASITALETVLVGGLVAGLVAAGVGLYQVTKQSDDLTRALVMNRGITGLNTESAYALAASFKDIPKTKALEYMTELAKAGKFTSEEMKVLIPIVDEGVKYLGMSIKDIIKDFEDLKKNPTEALLDLKVKTGAVSDEAIKLAAEAERMGDKTKAGFIAAAEGVRIFKESIDIAKQDLTEFGKFMIGVKKFGESFWEGFKSKFSMSKIDKEISDLKRNLSDAELNQTLFGSAFDEEVKKAKKELEDFTGTSIKLANARSVVAKNEVEVANAMKNVLKYTEESKNSNQKYIDQKYIDTMAGLAREKALLVGKTKLLAAVEAKELRVKKEYEDTLKKELKEKADALKMTDSQRESLNLYNSTIKRLIGIREEAQGKTEKLTKAEIAYNEALAQGAAKGFGPKQIAKLQAERESAVNAEKLKEYLKEEEKLKKELVKYDERRKELSSALTIEYMKQKEALEKESDSLDLRVALLGKTEEEAKKITREYQHQADLRAADAEYAIKAQEIWKKFIDIQNKTEGAVFDIDAYEKAISEAEEIRVQKGIIANRKIAVSAAEEMMKEFNRITDGITDAIVTALFEGGQAGKKKLRDVIVAELRKPITVVVEAVVKSITGNALNSVLGIGQQTSAGSGFLQTGASLVQAGSSLGGMLGGGIGAIGAGTGAFGSGLSMAMSGNTGLAVEGGLSMIGSSSGASSMMAGLGQTLGAVAPWLAAAYAIYSIAKSLDKSGTMHTGGSSVFSAAGGLTTGAGVSGVGSKAGAYSTDVEKFTTELSKGVVSILDATAITFGKTAGFEAATAFADDTSKDGAWGALVISKLGQDLVNWQNTDDKWPGRTFADGTQGSEQYVNAVARDVRTALESIGLPAWATDMLKKLGDAPTLDQLATTVAQINSVQKAIVDLGTAMPAFANMTIETVNDLVGAVGGVENLASLTSSFYSNFYKDSEKLTTATEILKKQFSDLGIAMPTDRLEYRKKIEEAMAAGNETLVATLLQMSGAFANVVSWGDDVTETGNTVSETLKSLQEEYSDLSIQLLQAQGKTQEAEAAIRSLAINGMTAVEITAYDANQALKSQILAQETVNKENERIAASLKSLSTEGKNLGIELLTAKGMTDAAKEATRALAIEGMSALEIAAYDANQSIRSQIEAVNAANKAAADAAAEKTRLEEEAAAKAKQIADERYGLETQLLQLQGNTTALRERELAALDPSNRALMEQIWAQEEANKQTEANAKAAEEAASAAQQAAEDQARAAEQLKSAWQSITDTIFEEVRRIRGLAAGDSTNLVSAQSNFDIATARARAGDQEAAKALPDLSKALLQLAESQAGSLTALRRIQMYTAASLEMTGSGLVNTYGLAVPAFASGGAYSGGLALVGEQGPELINFNSGGTVHNARSTASMMNNSNLEAAVEKLNANLEGLRFEVRANVSHAAKTAKILDRAMKDGETLSVSFETAQPVTVV